MPGGEDFRLGKEGKYIPSDRDVLEFQKHLPTVWEWIYITVKNTGAR